MISDLHFESGGRADAVLPGSFDVGSRSISLENSSRIDNRR